MTHILPPDPSLEHLKGQAKALLKAQRNGNPSACPTFRRLNRFACACDSEILSAKLNLHEAQFVLALNYGFPSWNALKQYVEQLAINREGQQ